MVLTVTDRNKRDDHSEMNRRAQDMQAEALKEQQLQEGVSVRVFGAAVPDGVGSVRSWWL